jgi:hypothetical protein
MRWKNGYEWSADKALEGNGSGLFEGTLPALIWGNRITPKNIST